MLKQLRQKKTMKRILWALAILIIPPFVFWGAGSALRSRGKGADYAGIIFGKKVSFDEYANAWQATKNQAMMMYGSKLDEILEALNLDEQAWDRLILLHEAKKKRIRVSDKEVVDTIQKFPFFQSRGGFDNRAYNMILAQVFRVEPRQFEEEIRDSLVISRLRDSVIQNIKISEEELKEEYKKENEKSKIAYILIAPGDFSAKGGSASGGKKYVRIDEALLKRYYQDNAESFRVPEQANIEYLGFEFEDYKKDLQFTDEQIKKYYDEHKGEFDAKKKFEELKEAIKNKLIQARASQKALEAAEKIDYILADKTKSFEEVAKENSIPIKETGFFQKEGPIPQIGWFPEIQKITFKLNVGERSELIKSKMGFAKGYYIIKLKEKKPSYIPTYEETKTKIENILKEEKAELLALKEAQRLHKKILNLVKGQVKFEEAVLKVHRTVKYTEPFTRNGYAQGLGMAGELGEEAFRKRGEISPVIKTRAGSCIFTVIDITPIDEEKFKKEKEEFTKKTLEAKKSRVLNEWYLELIKKANLKSNTSSLQ